MGILDSILHKTGFGEIPKELRGGLNTPPSEVPLENFTTASSIESSRADVATRLDQLADAHEDRLDWRHSIVDLLTLLGIHSDVATRRTLAQELGCPTTLINDDTEMDQWLHEAFLNRIAQRGGNIPPELFH